MLTWPEKSSSLWFLGSHSADLVRWLFGCEVVEVTGVRTFGVLQKRGLDIPDVWVSILKFENGGIGVIENAWILPENLPGYGDFRSEIVAENGVYYTQLQAPEVNEMYTSGGAHQRLDYLTQLDIRGARYGFTLQSIQYFVDCVLSDTQPFISLTDGLANTEILCGVEASAAAGGPHRLRLQSSPPSERDSHYPVRFPIPSAPPSGALFQPERSPVNRSPPPSSRAKSRDLSLPKRISPEKTPLPSSKASDTSRPRHLRGQSKSPTKRGVRLDAPNPVSVRVIGYG
jgi:hypothetical protein